MAKSPFSKRDDEHQLTRRALIQWSVAAGAALGVSRAKIFDILEKTGGKELAQAASENATTRSVHIVAGNGGLAWFQLMWPQVDIAAANDANLSYHRPGMTSLVPGTDRPLAIGPDTPWQTLPPGRQLTGFVCGTSVAHTNDPVSTATLNNNNIYSVASALQSSTPSVIPLITINVNGQPLSVGTAPGGARPSAVSDATGIVNLFNSAASRAGGLLSKSQDATTYAVQYSAFAQLNRAAARSTQKASYGTAIGAAGLLGTNLAAKLTITAADLTRYGNPTRGNVKSIAQGLIVAVKAFKMGLTNSIVMPAMNDDPHGAFANGDTLVVAPQLKAVLDAFMTDLQNTTDDVTQKVLADDTVITINGDTPKDATSHGGGNWGDGTPQGSNLLYVYGAGNLKTGWFGGINRGGTVNGYDAAANAATYNSTNTSRFAMASVAYAIAKRDDRAISTFANGTAVSGIFGVAKLQ